MKLFGQIIRTAVNTVLIPVALVADVATLGGIASGKNDGYDGAPSLGKTYTGERLQKLKDEAQEE